MLQFPDHAREMRKGEEDAVDALLKAAFETNSEANLVRALLSQLRRMFKDAVLEHA
jgi:putative acetyltransferase